MNWPAIYEAGKDTSATVRHLRCCNGWKNGSGAGCDPSSGSNGSEARCDLLDCANGTSELTLRHRPPVVPMDLGAWRTVQPCPSHCRLLTSTRSAFRACWRLLQLNRTEPPYADPHVRWCGRGEWVTTPPMPIDMDVMDPDRKRCRLFSVPRSFNNCEF